MINQNLIQTLRMASNPALALQQIANQDPIFKKAFDMTNGKSEQEIMQIAENLAKSQGKDFNQVKQDVINQLNQIGLM